MNLINQVAKDNKESLEKLYLTYKTSVFRLALVMLNDWFLAEDVVQETFFKVQKNAKLFRYGTNERAWIMTIAHNVAIDILKKREKEIVQEEVINEKSIYEDMMSGDNREGFLHLIQPLNDLDKQIVSLHLIGGLKHREIAQIIGMNGNTVKKRYERAIKKIAQGMEKNK